MYQAILQPCSGKTDIKRGTRGPVTMRPILDPVAAIPVASPLKLGPNHADIRAMVGTFDAPLPNPVTVLQSRADQTVLMVPVSSMLDPVKSIPMEMINLGPYFDARAPPISDSRRYPVKFAVASPPAPVLSRFKAVCIDGRTRL